MQADELRIDPPSFLTPPRARRIAQCPHLLRRNIGRDGYTTVTAEQHELGRRGIVTLDLMPLDAPLAKKVDREVTGSILDAPSEVDRVGL